MTPDASKHDPTPDYIRGLIKNIPMSQVEIARRVGVSTAHLRYLAAGERTCSYPLQFCLEVLCGEKNVKF